MTLSPYFDKFPENLICEEIILKMGLPILNRKCETISINGFKTETVGLVKTTVQCIKNGVQHGTIYIKAKVVRDFYKLFGSDGLCSEQLRKKLTTCTTNLNIDTSMSEETDDEQKRETEPTDEKLKKKKKNKDSDASSGPSITKPTTPSSQASSSPSYSTTQSSKIRNLQTSPRSPLLPPGFSTPFLKSRGLLQSPPQPLTPPMFSTSTRPTTQTPSKVPPASLPKFPVNATMSPYSSNINRLAACFEDADIADTIGQRRAILHESDPHGTFDISSNGVSFAFSKSREAASSPSVTCGPVYRSGHGRLYCTANCRHRDPPHNCGYHPQWQLPPGFHYCGYHCKGGLCKCLRLGGYSDDYGYYG